MRMSIRSSKENGFENPVDLLSLDIDGVDYWVWEALDVIRPRVVIAEIQCIWGSDRAVTVPYSPGLPERVHRSIRCLLRRQSPGICELARKKGYRLVGVERLGFNAIFVAEGVGEDLLPEVDSRLVCGPAVRGVGSS